MLSSHGASNAVSVRLHFLVIGSVGSLNSLQRAFGPVAAMQANQAEIIKDWQVESNWKRDEEEREGEGGAGGKCSFSFLFFSWGRKMYERDICPYTFLSQKQLKKLKQLKSWQRGWVYLSDRLNTAVYWPHAVGRAREGQVPLIGQGMPLRQSTAAIITSAIIGILLTTWQYNQACTQQICFCWFVKVTM